VDEREPSEIVDTLGLLLHAIVHSAGIQDRDGGIALLATLFGRFPFLAKLFADSAYQGPIFGSALYRPDNYDSNPRQSSKPNTVWVCAVCASIRLKPRPRGSCLKR
jgi:hypothetical protein